MKKISVISLIALCCVLFSACNSGENQTETTAPTSQVTTSSGTIAKEIIQPATTAAEQTTGAETTKAIEETTDLQEEVTQAQNDEPSEHADEISVDLQMTIGNTPVSVDWEDNEAAEALKDLCRNQPLTIQMSMYGGFEQVGPIGTALPHNDVQTTTSAGDIVLYSGDQMVVFYGSNSWAYTRLGHITDRSAEDMTDLLSNGDTVITISLA